MARRARCGRSTGRCSVQPSCACAPRPRSSTTSPLRGLRYQPAPATALTRAHAALLDDVVARRDTAWHARLPAGDGREPARLSRAVLVRGAAKTGASARTSCRTTHASIATQASRATLSARTSRRCWWRLAERYPGVAGFRLDWPEYPPYDLVSALFDFNPSAQALMEAAGHDPAEVAAAARAWRVDARARVTSVITPMRRACRAALAPAWQALLARTDRSRALFDAKRAAVRGLLTRLPSRARRRAGARRRLEPQVFPPPFGRVSGFALDRPRRHRRCRRREALHDALADDRRATGRATSSAAATDRLPMRRASPSPIGSACSTAASPMRRRFAIPSLRSAIRRAQSAQRTKLATAEAKPAAFR